VFCGNADGKLTKEHILPRWLGKISNRPLFSRTEHVVSKVEDHLGGQLTEYNEGKINRPGDPLQQTLRIVCGKCNSGWMSRLQEEARPVITRLITNFDANLNERERISISLWMMMTTAVIEYADMRTKCLSDNEDSLGWALGIAPYIGSQFNGSFWHRAVRDLAFDHQGRDVPFEHLGQFCIFGMNNVLFYSAFFGHKLLEQAPGVLNHPLRLGFNQLTPFNALQNPASVLPFDDRMIDESMNTFTQALRLPAGSRHWAFPSPNTFYVTSTEQK
jgi:hypothetical protein